MKLFVLVALVLTALMFNSCSVGKNGDRVLMVSLAGDDAKDVTDLAQTQEALKFGGYVTINVDVMRKVDSDFDVQDAVSDKDGKFLVNPAMLNAVGSHGWHLVSVSSLGNSIYYFTKPYEKRTN